MPQQAIYTLYIQPFKIIVCPNVFLILMHQYTCGWWWMDFVRAILPETKYLLVEIYIYKKMPQSLLLCYSVLNSLVEAGFPFISISVPVFRQILLGFWLCMHYGSTRHYKAQGIASLCAFSRLAHQNSKRYIDFLCFSIIIESTKTTSLEDVSTGVLDKNIKK